MAIKNRFLDQGNNSNYGHRNFLINGDFRVWQRGGTFSNATSMANAYTADRWYMIRNSWNAGMQVTHGKYDGINDSIQIYRIAGNSLTTGMWLYQSLETVEVQKLAGKTVTLSFLAQKASGFTASGITANIFTSTDTDGNAINIASPVAALSSAVTLTTSMARYYFTTTIPSNAKSLYVRFDYNPTGTAGANDYYELSDVQLELGSIATAFERRLMGTELALCQRYYEKSYDYSVAPGTGSVASQRIGLVTSIPNGCLIGQAIPYKVNKRTTPTVTVYSLNGAVGKATYQGGTDTAAGVTAQAKEHDFIIYNATGGSITATNDLALNWTADAELY